MKVLIASGTYPPQLGGMATFVKGLAERLARFGVDVRVVAYADVEEELDEPYPVRLVSRRRGVWSRYRAYARAARQMGRGCDVVYAQDLISSGLPAAMASRWLRRPLVVRLGGDFLWEKMVQNEDFNPIPLREYYNLPKTLKERFYLFIYRRVLGRASMVIFNTDFQAELYRKHFNLARKQVVVLYNPVTIRPRDKTVVAPRIVYAGRFIRLKNIDLLIKAYQHVSADTKLVLIGSGPSRKKLAILVASLGLSERVEILPPMRHDDLVEYLAASYLVVVPALTELNPNIALEALGVGTPVLVTAENGLPEPIKQQIEQFDPTTIASLTEKFQALMEPHYYDQYRQRIQHLHVEHTWEEVARQHIALFNSLIA